MIYAIVLCLSSYRLSMNSFVYYVSSKAPTAYKKEHPIKAQEKTVLSYMQIKKNPRVIQLKAHPISTLTVFISHFQLLFSLMKTKVKLFNGPMQKFAIISPTLRSQSNAIELMNNNAEANLKIILLPIISDSIPAEKLPAEYAKNVRSVRSSKSGTLRKMTQRTNNPDSQNYAISKIMNAYCLLIIDYYQLIIQLTILLY